MITVFNFFIFRRGFNLRGCLKEGGVHLSYILNGVVMVLAVGTRIQNDTVSCSNMGHFDITWEICFLVSLFSLL